ncbi:hemolysin family protein [Paenibacillus sp. GCM10023248]|uniref:hemolysin family protein n=1 Tax=Bacillales TaxID=1385 RepID=UPI0023798119|nr:MULTISPECIES: hemolysin family protein [Bacillales]MDD9265897.1 hemolysin family protein [Paenibacillus sp. MAHUQ-63]MDR6879136.1 CBS domain containing-hemolysin-like protein [Bacillus sp. 3255]
MVINLIVIALLILLTAFFVATEFAVIRIRPSRVDQMVAEGTKNARAVQSVVSNLDGYLSACQLGITITALGLGWLGEPTVEKMLHPFFEWIGAGERLSHFLSFTIAFVSITYIHVVLGELAPKTLAIQKAEAISIFTAPLIIYFYKVMYPFIWILNGSANQLVKAFGMKPATEHEEAHSEEEIRIILSDSYMSGKINKTEFGYVNRIFSFDELLAREIMVPRTDMICLYAEKSLAENKSIIMKEQYTRFPVAKGSKDHIIGFINTKQFFLRYMENPSFDLHTLLQPMMTVPESMLVKVLLRKMQQENVHIALLLDEYGGTSGLITIEDILEEIVGEIRDEFDKDEKKEIEHLGDNHYLVDGIVLVNELNYLLGTDISDENVDSIGGWLYSKLPEIAIGEEWHYQSLTFIVRERDDHRIRKIEIKKKESSKLS